MDPAAQIFHLCSQAAWDVALSTGLYRGTDSDCQDGFLHFSTFGQVRESAARHHANAAALVMLTVDSVQLGEELKWEKSRGGALFPHLYGPLPLSAVLRADLLGLGPDQRHGFPDWFVTMEGIASKQA